MIESFNDKVLQEDLEIIAKEELPFQKFRNSTVFITGVTGLVGLQLFKALACINRVHQLNMKIIGLVRNLDKAEKIFGDLLKRKGIFVGLYLVRKLMKQQGLFSKQPQKWQNRNKENGQIFANHLNREFTPNTDTTMFCGLKVNRIWCAI